MKPKKRQMSPAAADTSGPPTAAAQQPARPSEVLPTSGGSLLPFARELDRNLMTAFVGHGAATGAANMGRVRITSPNARAISRLLSGREGRTETLLAAIMDEIIEFYVLAHGGYHPSEIDAARAQVVASRQRARDVEADRVERHAARERFEQARIDYERRVQEAADQAERDAATAAERAATQLQAEREERAALMRATGARETKQLVEQRFEFDVQQELQRRAAPRLLEALLPK